MGLFQNDIQVVGKPNSNKSDKVKLKSLNGYDAIRGKLDEGNALTVVKNPVVNEKAHTKSVLVYNYFNYFICIYRYWNSGSPTIIGF